MNAFASHDHDDAHGVAQAADHHPHRLVGDSPAMREVGDLIDRVANASAPVLILGETGTGKGMVARAIHAAGASRASAPFITVNCAALPENLLESELFGHVKGAFTGATANRTGLLEAASGGTLFLDEIAEMSPNLQAKLLRVVEDGFVRAVGANRERAVDARILAATHRDLRVRVRDGLFREDLLYRLDVVTIAIPPLRRRRDDLPSLVEHFLAKSRARHESSPVKHVTNDAMERLLAHPWPGNVRELEHVIERAVLLGRHFTISANDLPPLHKSGSANASGGNSNGGSQRRGFGGEIVPMREIQRQYAAWAYDQLGGRKMVTAAKLNVDFRTLCKLLK